MNQHRLLDRLRIQCTIRNLRRDHSDDYILDLFRDALQLEFRVTTAVKYSHAAADHHMEKIPQR